MPLEKLQVQDLNLWKIDPNHSLTREEVVEMLKITKNYEWENLDNKISNNSKINNLILRDYSQINKDRLSTYEKYWVNMISFQDKLVKLWFDLWKFWKSKNWVDWSF
jgi:hypothetical protein